MKEYYTSWESDDARPEVGTIEAIEYCLDTLTKNDKVSFTDEIVEGLTFEEVIGALLCGYDLAKEVEVELMWAEGKFDL